ncbi:SGNH/GDSL hydrolase family protein [Candidatus Azambacteria bacterium]|nr:SGNH/GDSL hydrolase family protein [Candidatus Azambacteria bacterium]
MSETWKRKIMYGGAIVGAVILILGGLELLLRPKGAPRLGATILAYGYSSTVLGDFSPNQDVVSTLKPALPYHVTVNGQGYRDREVAVPKPGRTFRILMLGDSFVEGPFVNDEETLPRALERIMLERQPNRAVEVVNAGHSGYTITDEMEYYDEKGYRFDPDLVILVFGPNDIADLTKPVQAREFLKISERVAETSLLTRKTQEITQHSALLSRGAKVAAYLLTKFRIRSLGPINPDALRERLDQGLVYVPDPPPEVKKWFSRYEELLLEFFERIRRDGRQFLFVLFPTSEQMVETEPGRPQAILAAFGEKHRIPFVDLLPQMRFWVRRGETLYLDPLDRHPTPQGYWRAAEKIQETIP